MPYPLRDFRYNTMRNELDLPVLLHLPYDLDLHQQRNHRAQLPLDGEHHGERFENCQVLPDARNSIRGLPHACALNLTLQFFFIYLMI